VQVIGDVTNKQKISKVFERYRPHIVFHAAANKHVDLVEKNPDEAVLNNVLGTKNIIEAAEQYGAQKVVFISTDKAADPRSVLGSTKRLSELIVMRRRHPQTASIAVRFGNVLGSRGSVIPLFREQIKRGGPVTVTHPDMERYFMTIPEAAQLVLQAGAIGKCGDIFLLDMGERVKISEMARQMIRLSGFDPDNDVQVEYVGLRPGEKLIESLTGKDESIANTSHPKILAVTCTAPLPSFEEKDFDELRTLAVAMDEQGLLKKLASMVPTYERGK
jgi:FlaA1/EpsC-like NDP-sugar epimerase